MNKKNKIKTFQDLDAWVFAHKLVIDVYNFSRKFPEEEKFGLTSQMRRSAVSITSNIAEGFSRRTSKDKTSFYFIALGSLTELQNQLIIARDLKYLSGKDCDLIYEKSITVHKLINGLIKGVSKLKLNT